MEKFNSKFFILCSYTFLFTMCLCPYYSILNACSDSIECHCDLLENFDYSELEEYEEIFRNIECILDSEDSHGPKWCRKLKKWFKRQIYNLFKNFINIKRYSSPDACAYNLVKFKRNMDRLYYTGNIEKLLDEIDKQSPPNEFMETFKKRIKYYSDNSNISSPGTESDRYDMSVDFRRNIENEPNELEKYPIRAVFGGFEIGCGIIIAFIPFPGCKYVGYVIIGDGVQNIINSQIEAFEND